MKTLDVSSKVKSVGGILLNLKKEDGTALVNKEEAKTLENLKFKNGENILSLQYKWFVYEIIWLLNKKGYEITYNYLNTNWETFFGSHNIRKKMLFENPLMESTREKFLIDMEIFRKQTDLVEAGEKCRRCQSDSTVSTEKQQKSCDESVNIYIFCLSCSFKWRAQ